MKRRWFLAGAAALVLAAFAAGFFLSRPASAPPRPEITPEAIARLFATPYPDLSGNTRTLEEWRGQPLVVNFWATWCPPCLREMPVFSRAQEQHPGIRFVGIAVDTDKNVREFAAKTQVSYTILLGSKAAFPLMVDLGNFRRGLPFTVAFDASGKLRHVFLGALDEAETTRLIATLEPR